MSILRADSIRDRAGTGAPDFPNGLTGTLTGTATTATALSGTPNITVGTVTGTDATFSGNLTVQGTTTTIDSATLSVEDKNIGIGSVTTPTNTTANGGGLTLFGGADGDKEFKWTDSSAGPDYWNLTGGYLYSGEGLNARKLLREGVKILGNDLGSVSTIDVVDGMVHYRTANLGTDIRPNIRYSSTTTLNDVMNTGEAITVTIIHAVNNTNHNVSGLEIDGSIVTVNWVGGSAPSDGGGSGVDIYAFNIIKTAANTYTVIGNQTKTS